MRIHYLQHVGFENLANIESWTNGRDHSLSSTKLYLEEKLPNVDSFDWLVVMGGPMNIYEDDKYTWLSAEKKFIGEAIKSGKFVLGICLGAQLVADVLGGKVVRNKHKEIGWFPVRKTESDSRFLRALPQQFTAFHWHGDTFEIPSGAKRIAESDGCDNQAFEYGGNVLALQFHLELSPENIGKLIKYCREDMTASKYVQTEEEILSAINNVHGTNALMNLLLNDVEKARS